MNSPALVPPPSFDQVDEVPSEVRRTVPAEHLDINGHMNVRHYLGAHVDALDGPLFTNLGFGLAYINGGRSFFQVDNHMRYLAEVRGGDEISVHIRFIGRTPRSIHAVSFLLNRSTRALANTMEFLLLNVDLRTRRTVDFDKDATHLLDQRIAVDSQLPWPAPTSGCIPHGR